MCNPAFSTFIIFPLSGKIAWLYLSLPCFAEPPAESPSTIKISHSSAFLEVQSASFPGRDPTSKTDFLKTNSLAFWAASLAFLEFNIFSTTIFVIAGLSSKNIFKLLETIVFGLTVATLLILFVVPLLYSIFYKIDKPKEN